MVRQKKISGFYGLVNMLQTIKKEGGNVHEDDLPNFLSHKAKAVSSPKLNKYCIAINPVFGKGVPFTENEETVPTLS